MFKEVDLLQEKDIHLNFPHSSELLNTKQLSIARLESGNYNPSIDFLKKIAEVLDAELEVKFVSKAS